METIFITILIVYLVGVVLSFFATISVAVGLRDDLSEETLTILLMSLLSWVIVVAWILDRLEARGLK